MRLAHKMKMGADAIDARERFDPEHRRRHMNGSEADTCIRKQWYEKNQPEKGEEDSWGYARRGHNCERYTVEALLAANVDLRYHGYAEDQQQQSFVIGDISSTPDGVIVNHEDENLIVPEFKSVDPRKKISSLPMREHVTQIQIAMASIDENASVLGLPDWNISHGVILYLDASNFDVVHEHRVIYDPTLIDQLQPRAKKLLNARSPNGFKREGKIYGGHECNQRCRFKAICWSAEDLDTDTSGPARANRGSRLDGAVSAYYAAQLDEKDAKDRKAVEKERILAEMKKRKTNEITVGGRDVKLTSKAGSVSYAKVVKEHCPDVDLEDYRGNPSTTLTVK